MLITIIYEFAEPEMQDIDHEIVLVVTVVINSNILIYSTINYQFVLYMHHSGHKK